MVRCSCSVHDSCSTGKVFKARYAHTHAYLRLTPLYISCVVCFIYLILWREQRNVPDTCTPSRTHRLLKKSRLYTNKLCANVAVVLFRGCVSLRTHEKVLIQFGFIFVNFLSFQTLFYSYTFK